MLQQRVVTWYHEQLYVNQDIHEQKKPSVNILTGKASVLWSETPAKSANYAKRKRKRKSITSMEILSANQAETNQSTDYQPKKKKQETRHKTNKK